MLFTVIMVISFFRKIALITKFSLNQVIVENFMSIRRRKSTKESFKNLRYALWITCFMQH